MNDKTEQTVTDELRLAAKSAEPYLTATVGASHLSDAADTIDNLRAQLAEAQRDAERLDWLEDNWHRPVLEDWEDRFETLRGAIDAAKGPA